MNITEGAFLYSLVLLGILEIELKDKRRKAVIFIPFQAAQFEESPPVSRQKQGSTK